MNTTNTPDTTPRPHDASRKTAGRANPNTRPEPAPRPRHPMPTAELFPGAAAKKKNGPAHIDVFECEDERDILAIPPVDPNYVFHDTPEIRRVLHAVQHPDTPCWLVGPTGCGKTTLVEQICARARRPLTRINMDANLARSDFLGIWVFKEDQSMRFHHGPAATAIRDGHVLVLDEIDVANPGVLLLFQSCLEGRPFKVLETDETFPVHPDFRLFATANTAGRGDDTLLYRAAQVQNFAFLDRFRWVLPIAYPTVEAETRILLSRLDGALDGEVCEKLAKTAAEIRRAHENGDCEAPLSTRTLLDMAHDMLNFDGDHEAAFRYCFLHRLPERDRKLCERLIHAVWGSAGGTAAKTAARTENRAAAPKTPGVTRSKKGSKKALLDAAKDGRLTEVRVQIAAGVEVDGTISGGKDKTALILAVENDHAEVVRELAAAGADVNARHRDFHSGGTALIHAASRGMTATLHELVAAGAELEAKAYGMTALMVAAEAGKAEAAGVLSAAGADMNARDGDGRTALLLAAANGKTETVKALSAAGADVNARDNDGETALLLAAASCKTAMAKALSAAGADVNAGDYDGRTALMRACACGYKFDDADVAKLVRVLLAAGADVNARDKDGRTAADYAKERARAETAEALRDAG